MPAWPARCIQDFSAGSCSDRGSCRTTACRSSRSLEQLPWDKAAALWKEEAEVVREGGEGDDGGRGRRGGRFRSYIPDQMQQEKQEVTSGGEATYGRRNGGFRGGFRVAFRGGFRGGCGVGFSRGRRQRRERGRGGRGRGVAQDGIGEECLVKE